VRIVSQKTRLILMRAHGIVMVVTGLALFWARAAMTNILFEVVGSTFALMLLVGSFLFSAVVDWVFEVETELHHIRELRRLLLVSGVAAVGCWFFLFSSTPSIRLLCYFTAANALILGIVKIRLARHLDHGSRERTIINVLGCLAICFSVMLAAMANSDERTAIAVLGCYSLFVGLVMLLATFYAYRQRAVPLMS
jgi:hypothetical protein